MQAFGAYASASVDLTAFAPPRHSQGSDRKPEQGAETSRGLLASVRRAFGRLGDETTPRLPRLSSYPY